MDIRQILSDVDAEIARLQQARKLIAGQNGHVSSDVVRNGKPLATKRAALSPEAKARISAAQKKRWAKFRKAAK